MTCKRRQKICLVKAGKLVLFSGLVTKEQLSALQILIIASMERIDFIIIKKTILPIVS